MQNNIVTVRNMGKNEYKGKRKCMRKCDYNAGVESIGMNRRMV
jgi:hypothetical protein